MYSANCEECGQPCDISIAAMVSLDTEPDSIRVMCDLCECESNDMEDDYND